MDITGSDRDFREGCPGYCVDGENSRAMETRGACLNIGMSGYEEVPQPTRILAFASTSESKIPKDQGSGHLPSKTGVP